MSKGSLPSISTECPKLKSIRPEPPNSRGPCPICENWLVASLTYVEKDGEAAFGYLLRHICINPDCAYSKLV